MFPRDIFKTRSAAPGKIRSYHSISTAGGIGDDLVVLASFFVGYKDEEAIRSDWEAVGALMHPIGEFFMDEPSDEKRSITMSEVMSPEKANFAGNVHGGYILQLLDRVAYACAARYSSSYVVTLSVDQVLFKQPIYVGELVTGFASVNYVGRTSMEVGIKVVAENLLTGKQRHTNSCYYTMVAVDENLRPRPVKPLTLHTAIQRRRFAEGKLRREMYRQFEEEHKRRKVALRENGDHD